MSSEPHPGPAISAILPLYQAQATIERALNSVLAQSVPALEIIVIDDGSTDDGASRVSAIDDPRIVLIRQRNAGSGAARNAGIRRATGTHVAFLDADDEWLPDFFENAAAAFRDHPDIGFYFGQSIELGLVSGTGAKAPEHAAQPPAPGRATVPVHCLEPPVSGGSKALKKRIDRSLCVMVARRDLISELGGYYDRNGCRYGEDSVLALLIHCNHPVLDQRTPVHMRHRLESGLTRSNLRAPELRPLVSDPGYVFERLDPAAWPLVRRLIAYLATLDASRFAKAGLVRPAWDALSRTMQLRDLTRIELFFPLSRFALRAIGLGRQRASITPPSRPPADPR